MEAHDLIFTVGGCSLCDEGGIGEKRQRTMLTAFVYNSSWISWSLCVVGFSVFWGIGVGCEEARNNSLASTMFQLLKEGADLLDAQEKVPDSTITSLVAQRAAIIENADTMSIRLRNWGITWSIMGVMLLTVSGAFNDLQIQFRAALLSTIEPCEACKGVYLTDNFISSTFSRHGIC